MVMKQFKLWFNVVRPFSLTASIIPVLLGGVIAMREGVFQLSTLALCLVAMTALQISANLISDCDDYLNQVDTKESFGSSGMIVNGSFTPRQALRGGMLFLALGSVLGLLLVYISGLVVLLLGVVGVVSAYFYTRKPFSLKYRGLGAPFVFLMFGPLPVLGAYYIQTQRFSLLALLLSVPIGLLTTAILHANDIRDITSDRKAGIQTFAMEIGIHKASVVYVCFLSISYLAVLLMMVFGTLSIWSAAVFLTLPVAVLDMKSLFSRKLMTLDKQTALLQLLFGGSLVASFMIM
ncbi:MAG: putative 1,4-dihydroxy-2-naphthoate octaprenyltransferase [Oscillospiraceae bacterium]|nr:putative 1,4-dihydroxy-2-naphthoate octaprenyltransferase [Oscillospiraceae bacterium]